jgi:lactoylglutathione lyase
MRVNYAIVFVSCMKRSITFYQDVIGLSLRFESPHWTEFATEGATLALHATTGVSSEKATQTRFPRGAAGRDLTCLIWTSSTNECSRNR